MSLMTSLYSGASGLEANSIDLSVIGDNIANGNTIGFKLSRATFADTMAQSIIGSNNAVAPNQRGLGTRLQVIQKEMSQGALTNTGLATDLGIDGAGFFLLNGAHQGVQGTYYTRAGQFTLDNSGYLVNPEGLRVQGYTANAQGVVNEAAVGDLQVGNASVTAKATTSVTIKANLDANATIPAAWDSTDPANTSNFSTSTTLYDSLGQAIQTTTYFRRSAAGTWEWHALADGSTQTGGTAGTAMEVAGGDLAFDTQGRLTAANTTVNAFNPINAVNPQTLTFNFGTPVPGGTGLDGVSQSAAASSASFVNQDGGAAGDLARISIDAKGHVLGAFTNGQSRVLGQLVLANFQAPDQLNRVGGNLYTDLVGQGATVGAASTANRGSLVSGTLEQSNVDMATEFVRMIAAQRAFQANSKTVTTADALLQELMTIKR